MNGDSKKTNEQIVCCYNLFQEFSGDKMWWGSFTFYKDLPICLKVHHRKKGREGSERERGVRETIIALST